MPIPIPCMQCQAAPEVTAWDDPVHPRFVHCPHTDVYAVRVDRTGLWVTSYGVTRQLLQLVKSMGTPAEAGRGEMFAALVDVATERKREGVA